MHRIPCVQPSLVLENNCLEEVVNTDDCSVALTVIQFVVTLECITGAVEGKLFMSQLAQLT